MFTQHHCFILTGAMGSGKSTLLEALKAMNVRVINEPARQIIAEQRCIEGEGVYDKNPHLFSELMLSRSIGTYQAAQSFDEPVIFDRGIPDNIAYFQWFKLKKQHVINAAKTYQYNPHVFFTPSWKAIYTCDDERTLTFEQAAEFAQALYQIYLDLGYQLYEVPKLPPQERAQWMIERIQQLLD